MSKFEIFLLTLFLNSKSKSDIQIFGEEKIRLYILRQSISGNDNDKLPLESKNIAKNKEKEKV